MKHFYKKLFIIDNLVIIAIALFVETLIFGMWYFDGMDIIRLLVISFVLLLVAALYAKKLIQMDPLVHVKEYCSKEGYSLREIEADFDLANKIGVRLREGNKWIYYMDKSGEPNLIRKSDIVYMDFIVENWGRNTHTFLAAYNSKDEVTKIPMSKKKFKKLRRNQDDKLLMYSFYQDRHFSKVSAPIIITIYPGLFMMVISIVLDRLFMTGVVIVCTTIIVVILYSMQKEISFQKVEDYCKLYGYSIEQLKEEFPSAVERGKNVRESKDWIYFMNTEGMPDVIRKEKITRTEYQKRCLFVFDVENNLTKIPLKKRKAELLQLCK